MGKIFYIFIAYYFLSLCLTFGNPMEGNRFDECGLGAVIFDKDDNGIISSTNMFIPIPFLIFSTTAGTSECKGFALNDKQRVKYIANNFYEIQIDVAKGEGTFLDGLTTIMGCDGTNFRKILKDDYSNIFNKDNSNGKQIYNALRHKIKNSELKNLCLDSS